MNSACESQVDALRVAKLDRVFHGLNCLGKVPWRIHDEMLNHVLEVSVELLKPVCIESVANCCTLVGLRRLLLY